MGDDTTADEAIETTLDVLSVAGTALIGAAAGLVLALLVGAVIGMIGRRRDAVRMVYARIKGPLRLLLLVIGAAIGFYLATRLPADARVPGWRGTIQHALIVAVIVAITWLVAALANVAEDFALRAVRERAGEGEVSTHGRRIQTQAVMLRRVGVVVIWVIGIAVVLLTFPGARAAGASMLASAGVLSVVAGIAAQGTLANLFAGLQLAFTDAIRVDDTIVIDGEYGYIEEITLTYVVVLTWDNRRIILPSSHFTTNPFENWTRRETSILGTVTFDVDWRVPVPAMRAEMQRLLDNTTLWDKNLGIFQVYDAVGGFVTVRALVSAKDPGTLVDLRYYLREELLDFLQTRAPYALPRTRIEDIVPPSDDILPPRARSSEEEARLVADLDELADIERSYREQDEKPKGAAHLPETVEARKQREMAARRARRRAARDDRRRAHKDGGGLGRRGQVRRRDDTGSQTTVMSREALDETLAASKPGAVKKGPEGAGTSGGRRRRGATSDAGARPGKDGAASGSGSGGAVSGSAASAWSSSAASGWSAASASSAMSAGEAARGWTARLNSSAISAISAGSANAAAVYPPGYPDDMAPRSGGDGAVAVPGFPDEYPGGPLRRSLVYRFSPGLSATSAMSARSASPAGRADAFRPGGQESGTSGSTTATGAHASSMFSGTPENEERGAKFSGPDESAQAELEAAIERRRAASTGETASVVGESGSTNDTAAIAFGSVAGGGAAAEDDEEATGSGVIEIDDEGRPVHAAEAEEGAPDDGAVDDDALEHEAVDGEVMHGPVDLTGDLGDAAPADVLPARSGETSVLPAVDGEGYPTDEDGYVTGGELAPGAGGDGYKGDGYRDDDHAGEDRDDHDGDDGHGRRGRRRVRGSARDEVLGREGSDLGGGSFGGGSGHGESGGDGGGPGGE
ncbi:MAG: mechanosensitive ion channel family protein [Micrococcaceae bacterium]